MPDVFTFYDYVLLFSMCYHGIMQRETDITHSSIDRTKTKIIIKKYANIRNRSSCRFRSFGLLGFLASFVKLPVTNHSAMSGHKCV